jgi:hypothetical protein
MERETALEPVTSSLGSHTYVESKSLVRFCCELLNLQHLAESAFFDLVPPNEAQTRQVRHLGDSDIQKVCYPDDEHAVRQLTLFPYCMQLSKQEDDHVMNVAFFPARLAAGASSQKSPARGDRQTGPPSPPSNEGLGRFLAGHGFVVACSQEVVPMPAPARATKSTIKMPSPEERIRRRAYELYVLRGNQSGSELDDWLQAEKEFLQDEVIDEEAAEMFGQPDR